MSVTRLIAYGVLTAALAALVWTWSLFADMYVSGRTQITVYTNKFGEFGLEFALFSLAVIFLPVVAYEFDQAVGSE